MPIVPAKCTQCGSNLEIDSAKEAGICPYCGSAFITEKAINNFNTFVTNNNNFSGATINYYGNKAMLEKHLANARRAKSKGDWAEVEKYYNYAEEVDPTCIEAIFYSSYAKARSTLIDSDIYKRKAAFEVLRKSISFIDENFKMENKESEAQIVEQIDKDLVSLINSTYVYNYKRNGYGITIWTDKSETVNLFINICATFIESLNNIVREYGADNPEAKYLYIIMANHCTYLINLKVQNKQKFTNIYNYCVAKVNSFSSGRNSNKRCNNCGTYLDADTVFCVKCGTKYEVKFRENENAHVCSRCGATVSDGSAFCTVCGNKIEGSKPANACSQCGAPITSDSMFCSSCGHKVK